MSDYKKYNLISFKRFVENILDKKHKGKFSYSDIKQQILAVLEKDTSKLSAKSFYKVILVLDEDLDKICERFFEGHPARKLDSLEKHANKMQRLFGPLMNSRKQLSEASGIKDTRLGEVFKERFEEMYAYEVFGLAVAGGFKSSDLLIIFMVTVRGRWWGSRG